MDKNLAAELEPEAPETPEAPAAEAPAVEKTEAPKAETPEEKPEEKKKDPSERNVAHGAFHEERQKRKEAEAKARQLEQNQAVLNDRLAQLWQTVHQPRQEAPQFRDPDKDPDPLEAMKHNQALLLQQQQREAQYRQQQEQYARQQEGARQLARWGAAQAQEFRQENPDFDEAYQHIRQIRAGELQAMGYAGDELMQALWQDEMMIFDRAHRSGKNPAEIAFNMARAAGWQKKEQKQPAEEKIDQLQKGAAAAKTLGNSGAPSGKPTAEQIAAMSDEEFAAFKAELKAKGQRLSDVM